MDIKRIIVQAEKVIERYKNPALLVSFGKDSITMLNMLQHLRLPVICYQTPWQPNRWEFARKMMSYYDVTVFDYPPEWTALQEQNGNMELVSGYSIGGGKTLGIRQRIDDHAPFSRGDVCGLNDCLRRPAGTIAFQWDLLLSAQKHNDPDHFGGTLNIDLDVKKIGPVDVYFPFRNVTDEEIWDHIKREHIAVDDERYHESGSNNPDVVSGCFDCVNRSKPERVKCPRLNGLEVNNISAQVPYLKIDPSI